MRLVANRRREIFRHESSVRPSVGRGCLAAGLDRVRAAARALRRKRADAQHDVGLVRRGRSAHDQFGARIRVPEASRSGCSRSRCRRALPAAAAGGALLATTPREGKVWLLEPDRDGDGRSDGAQPLLENLKKPHGLDLFESWLYVAEGDGVGRVRIDPRDGRLQGKYERVVNGLARGRQSLVAHGPLRARRMDVRLRRIELQRVRRIRPARPAMLRFRPMAASRRSSPRLRNSVGFDWQPGTNALYATDNGRDLLGDDFPPCELNRIEPGGSTAGRSRTAIASRSRSRQGTGRADPQLDSRLRTVRRAHAPARDRVPAQPEAAREWRGVALVAQHGSWNRTKKSGYKVVSLHWGATAQIEERRFLSASSRTRT
jgi:hypothetical protein